MLSDRLFPVKDDIGLCRGVKGEGVARLNFFLKIVGYLSEEAESDEFGELTEESLRRYQRENCIEETGTVTPETYNRTRLPNCVEGLSSLSEGQANTYTIEGNPFGLNKSELTYSITNSWKETVTGEVKESIKAAFSTWQEALESKLKFMLVPNDADTADIQIVFYRGEPHPWPDLEEFNTVSTNHYIVLAHAFYPLDKNAHLKSHIHFNASVPWNAPSPDGYNLTQVAVHEIGHALGLGHSKLCNSIMFMNYAEWRDELDNDSIEQIRNLYFANGSVTVTGSFAGRGGGPDAQLIVANNLVEEASPS